MSGNAADSISPVCRSETVPRGLSVTVKRESWLVFVRPMPIGGLNVSSEIDVRHSLTYGRDTHGGTSEIPMVAGSSAWDAEWRIGCFE